MMTTRKKKKQIYIYTYTYTYDKTKYYMTKNKFITYLDKTPSKKKKEKKKKNFQLLSLKRNNRHFK